jgi:hypothetical protein
MIVLPLLAGATLAADPLTSPSADANKKRIEREKAFLLRSFEELGKTLAFVNQTVTVLTEQAEAAAVREPEDKGSERLDLLDWYQRYADWVKSKCTEMDLELSTYFGSRKPGTDWVAWYEDLAGGFGKLSGKAAGTVLKLEGGKKRIEARIQKINTAVLERRVLVDKEDLELARELWPSYKVSYDRREAVYKELTDDEILRLRNDLRSLGERQMYFECLNELARFEQFWLDIKSEEFARQAEIVKAMEGNNAATLMSAIRSMIGTYETNMAALKRKSAELDGKSRGITRTGSLRTLDRLEELSRYYEAMKSRFDRQVEWLSGQLGSYQVDLDEIRKDL